MPEVATAATGARPTGNVTRILILAEVGVDRDGVHQLLAHEHGFDVVAAAADVEGALVALDQVGPDVVLLDLPLPAGADAVRTLVAAAPDVRVVALAVPEVKCDVLALAEAGASGYVPQGGSLEDLVAVIESVSRGEVLCSARIAATLMKRVGALERERELDSIEERLTARELDVLRLIEKGCSNKEIGAALSIEFATVKNHVHNILVKLDVKCRTQAAARARRQRSAGLA